MGGMIKLAAIVAGLVVLSGCVQHDYMGEQFAAVDPRSVAVYYDAARVPADMRVIGSNRAKADESMDSNEIVDDMVKKAASVGADAVLVEGVQTVETGATTSENGQQHMKTEWYTDANGVRRKRQVPDGSWSSSSTTTVQKEKVITAKFYRRGR
ncbi:MAG: hypothetical protein QM783_04900 [Phycisphaerales bacterium]